MQLPIARLVLICKAMDFAHKTTEFAWHRPNPHPKNKSDPKMNVPLVMPTWNVKQISVALQIKTSLTMGTDIGHPTQCQTPTPSSILNEKTQFRGKCIEIFVIRGFLS